MKLITSHITRCLLSGIVALLPIGGFVATVVYLESTISGSWLAKQVWYFPGLGLIAATVGIYLIGLTVSTFIGRWLWSLIDRILNSLPMLGRLYQTLKQIVGYGEGKDGIFREVVLVPNGRSEGSELGLVTNELTNGAGVRQLVIFVPDAPNPTAGRLVVIDANDVQPVPMPVNDVLKVLVSVGKSPLTVAPAQP
ncbi:MAG TPA: DUF502 domain-containing protein [Planctomycetaceae bacterium]|jgi:uncharacterized membrane protein|nr:DUF502 domain-containing protein [Planctomycetaceae bacterium]